MLIHLNYGTMFNQEWIVRVGDTTGPPSSSSGLKAVCEGWVRWAGWPKSIACDRGVHNRGIFAFTAGANGCRTRPAGLEAPKQIGRVERRDDVLKKMAQKAIRETKAIGKPHMDMVTTETINAVNEMSRRGGIAP